MISRKLWIVGLVGLALVGTAAAAAAMHPDADLPWKTGKRAHAQHAHAHPGFAQEGDLVRGAFVSFRVDAEGGALLDYGRVADGAPVPVFESISLSSYDADNASARARGAVYAAESGEGTRVKVRDGPAAGFAIRSQEGNVVTLVAADGIDLTSHEAQENWSRAGVRLAMGGHAARLVLHGAGNVSVDGRTITVELEPGSGLAFHLEKPRGDDSFGGHGPRHGERAHEGRHGAARAVRGGPAEH